MPGDELHDTGIKGIDIEIASYRKKARHVITRRVLYFLLEVDSLLPVCRLVQLFLFNRLDLTLQDTSRLPDHCGQQFDRRIVEERLQLNLNVQLILDAR